MVTNLAYFYETAKKIRGGKWVWVKDSNGEGRKNVLLGGTILNPKKGFDHLYAAQLVQYTPNQGCLIFRSFALKESAAANATSYVINGDGYGDAPEVGMLVMVAPNAVKVETLTADTTSGEVTKTVADYTGQSAKITAVEYDATNEKFTITLDNTLGALDAGAILVEATGTAKSASAKVLVPNPNTFIEADHDLMPTDGFGITGTANYSISTVYDKQAWIQRMQPLPAYVLANNRSLIDGIFWI